MSVTLYTGDSRVILPTLPAGSVQTVVTSPPYWGLRDYGVEGQIGLEPTPAEYVANLVQVFREVWRVLRDDGTLWLNLGDTYARSGGEGRGSTSLLPHMDEAQRRMGSVPKGSDLKEKDLIGLPWMVAFALRADGWYLRSEIIWHKSSCMPSSATDRPTRDHEQVFLLSKRAEYFCNMEAIREPSSPSSQARAKYNGGSPPPKSIQGAADGVYCAPLSTDKAYGQGRNKRSVWTIAPANYKDAHYAVFPEGLVEPCILAGSRPGDVVLDPFGGSGTVGRVALRLNRAALLIELNPAYVEQQERRVDGVQPFIPGLEAAL